MRKFLLTSLLLSFLTGCIYPTDFDSVKVNLGRPAGASSVSQDELSTKVRDSLRLATKDDAVALYTQTKGLVEYVKVTTKVKSTGELFQVLGKVQEDLQWKRETCKGFTDTIETELKAAGFEENKKLDDSVRTQLVTFFDEVANGCKLAYESKPNVP